MTFGAVLQRAYHMWLISYRYRYSHSHHYGYSWMCECQHCKLSEHLHHMRQEQQAHLMKFMSGDSGTCAARLKRSSRSSTTFWKESLKMPLMLQRTSTLGLPSSSCRLSSLHLADDLISHSSTFVGTAFTTTILVVTVLVVNAAAPAAAADSLSTALQMLKCNALMHSECTTVDKQNVSSMKHPTVRLATCIEIMNRHQRSKPFRYNPEQGMRDETADTCSLGDHLRE